MHCTTKNKELIWLQNDEGTTIHHRFTIYTHDLFQNANNDHTEASKRKHKI